MNDVERMQAQFAGLTRRVEQLEVIARLGAVAGADEVEAQHLAGRIGFPVSILVMPRAGNERRQLARALRGKGWSFGRISRVMKCDAKTIRRWVPNLGRDPAD